MSFKLKTVRISKLQNTKGIFFTKKLLWSVAETVIQRHLWVDGAAIHPAPGGPAVRAVVGLHFEPFVIVLF